MTPIEQRLAEIRDTEKFNHALVTAQDVRWLLSLVQRQRTALEQIAANKDNRYESTVPYVCGLASAALAFDPDSK